MVVKKISANEFLSSSQVTMHSYLQVDSQCDTWDINQKAYIANNKIIATLFTAFQASFDKFSNQPQAIPQATI